MPFCRYKMFRCKSAFRLTCRDGWYWESSEPFCLRRRNMRASYDYLRRSFRWYWLFILMLMRMILFTMKTLTPRWLCSLSTHFPLYASAPHGFVKLERRLLYELRILPSQYSRRLDKRTSSSPLAKDISLFEDAVISLSRTRALGRR